MDSRNAIRLLAATAALAWGAASHAATISLQPASPTVSPNAAFTVTLNFNANDLATTVAGLFGGEVIVDFDPAQLRYDGFALGSGVSYFSAPVTGTAGARQTVTFGFDNAVDDGLVGTFSFTALAPAGTTAAINIADADQFFGTFVSYTPTYQPIYPDFLDAQVQVVPLPGAALLALTAFGAAAARARRPAAVRRREA